MAWGEETGLWNTTDNHTAKLEVKNLKPYVSGVFIEAMVQS